MPFAERVELADSPVLAHGIMRETGIFAPRALRYPQCHFKMRQFGGTAVLRVLILLALLGFAGAASATPAFAQGAADDQTKINEQARLKIEGDVANCRAREDAGAFKTQREAAQCVNSAVQRVMLSIRYPYTDLLQLVSAFRVGCAGKIDSGVMTTETCKTQMAELRKRVTTEEQKRRTAAAGKADPGVKPASGTKRTDMATLLKGLAGWTNADDPAPISTKHLNCMQVGQTVSCY